MFLSIRTAAVLSLSTLHLAAAAARAGDLNPPIGPVAPTMKTLTEVEPRIAVNAANTPGDGDSVYKITEVGSYYLTDDLLGEPGKHGIEIFPTTFGAVTIDLNGFSLYGVPGSLDGVNGSGNVDIRNGSAYFWGGDGVFIVQGTVENVQAVFNGGEGITALIGCVVVYCNADANGGHGIFVGDTASVSHCIAKGNALSGIHVDGACTITDCIAYANDTNGIEGGLSTIQDCMLFSNMAAGIEDSGFSIIKNNSIHSGTTGILVTGSRSRIEANNIGGCLTGIDVTGTRNVIVGNTCTNNGTNFEFPLGILNTVGEILDFTAGGVVTSHNPWANFEY